MRIPKSIRVFHLEYRVEFVESATITNCLGFEAFGYCDTGNRVIWIDSGLSPVVAFDTFLHESLHAYCEALGIPEDAQEQICTTGATVLVNLFAQL